MCDGKKTKRKNEKTFARLIPFSLALVGMIFNRHNPNSKYAVL